MLQVPDFNPAALPLPGAYPSLNIAVRCSLLKVAKDTSNPASTDVPCNVEYVIGVNYADLHNTTETHVPVLIQPMKGHTEIPGCSHSNTDSSLRGCDGPPPCTSASSALHQRVLCPLPPRERGTGLSRLPPH